MSKLTLKDWLLYNNALLKYDKSLIFNISFDEVKATGIGKVNIVRFGDNQVQLLDNDIVVWTEFENCKLVLRPIQDLTKKEKKYILNEFSDWDEEDLILLKETCNDFTDVLFHCMTKNAVNLANYLREQNIMIETENLFLSGKAVKQ